MYQQHQQAIQGGGEWGHQKLPLHREEEAFAIGCAEYSLLLNMSLIPWTVTTLSQLHLPHFPACALRAVTCCHHHHVHCLLNASYALHILLSLYMLHMSQHGKQGPCCLEHELGLLPDCLSLT